MGLGFVVGVGVLFNLIDYVGNDNDLVYMRYKDVAEAFYVKTVIYEILVFIQSMEYRFLVFNNGCAVSSKAHIVMPSSTPWPDGIFPYTDMYR